MIWYSCLISPCLVYLNVYIYILKSAHLLSLFFIRSHHTLQRKQQQIDALTTELETVRAAERSLRVRFRALLAELAALKAAPRRGGTSSGCICINMEVNSSQKENKGVGRGRGERGAGADNGIYKVLHGKRGIIETRGKPISY